MLMTHTPLIYVKSSQINSLYSPLPALLLGLSDADKVTITLSAITQVVKFHPAATVLTPELTEKVKQSFEDHWKEGNKVRRLTDVCEGVF